MLSIEYYEESTKVPRSALSLVAVGFFALAPVAYFVVGLMPNVATGLPIAMILALSLAALIKQSPELWLGVLAGLLVWQNAALGFFASLAGTSPPLYSVEMKTLVLFTSSVIVCFVSKKPQIAPWRLLTLVLWALALAVGLRSGLNTAAIGYIRNFLTPLVLGVCGFYLTTHYGFTRISTTLKSVATFVVSVLAIGALAETLAGTAGWRALLGISALTHLGKIVSVETTLFGFTFDRHGSFVIEPISMAFLAAGCLLIFAFLRGSFGWLLMAAALVVASAGKGAMLFVAISLFVAHQPRLVASILRRPWRSIFLLWGSVTVIGLVYVGLVNGFGFAVRLLIDPENSLHGGNSAVFHIAGFVAAVALLASNPLGKGLGAGGNLTSGLSDAAHASGSVAGNDTALGALLVQLGILGALAYAALIVTLVKRSRESSMRGVVIGLISAYVCGWVFQEEISGPVGSSLILLLLTVCAANRDRVASNSVSPRVAIMHSSQP